MDDRYTYPSNYPSGNDFIPDSGTMVNMDSLEATSPYSYAQPTQYNPYSYAPPVGSLGDGTGGGMGMVGGGSGGGGVGMSSGVVDGNIGSTFYASDGLDDPFADEPPLLEELGINFDQIMQKTLAVLIPFKKTEQSILHESDLTGPLVFCFAFGMFLLLSGKLHFSYIYGIGIVGCLSVYFLLNLMSPGVSSISFICTVSVLGYSLLPMVVLSGLSVIFNLSTGIIGNAFAITAVLWCALSASKLFVTALALQRQQPLIAYPCALLYGVFALLTVF